jgi:hypothetical protein
MLLGQNRSPPLVDPAESADPKALVPEYIARAKSFLCFRAFHFNRVLQCDSAGDSPRLSVQRLGTRYRRRRIRSQLYLMLRLLGCTVRRRDATQGSGVLLKQKNSKV